LQTELKAVLPALISEENWDIRAVVDNLGGQNLPVEMRKELQKLVKKHGITKAVDLTHASVGSAARWGRGEHGTFGVLKMGKLPWKSMLSGAVTRPGKRHANSKVTDGQQRAAVYRMITERPELNALADEFKVSVTALYSWRAALLGKSGTKGFASKCEAFIASFAAESGEEPKPLAEMRIHQAEKKTTEKRRQYSTAFKRRAVNRFENQNESIHALVKELGITDASIYSWRRQILGQSGSKGFNEKARALAREFIEQAQADDVVMHANAPVESLQSHAPHQLSLGPPQRSYDPQPYSRAPGLEEVSLVPESPIEAISTSMSNQPNAILAALDVVDRQLASLAKDRQLLVQQLEIQKLRRALSQSD
ncbi:MAG: transposase, partial [Alphaproteobacteria bacterium]